VMTARGVAAALVSIAETIPDLIVSDVVMPGGDGYSLVARLRQNPRTDVIPIVFLTAKDQRRDRLSGIRAGVDAYLTKPFEPEELIATVNNILRRVSRTHTRVALAASAPISKENELAADSANNPPHTDDNLSRAEERVAALVAEGLSNKQIASRLEISVRTVESHISHILSKHNWSSRVDIVRHVMHPPDS